MAQTPAERPALEGLPPLQHQTLALTDFHQINGHGIPGFHLVKQEIRALEPMTEVPFIFDASKDEIEEVQGHRGCQAVDPRPRPTESGFHIVDLVLNNPLSKGESATLEYTTLFSYKNPPSPQFTRRIGKSGMEALDITVRFEAQKMPRRVWWGAWEGLSYESPAVPGTKEEVQPSPVPSAEIENAFEVRRKRTAIIPGTILGFKWEW